VFWADPKTGIGYQVQVEVPPFQLKSSEEIGMVPIKGNSRGPLLVRDVAQIEEHKVPGEYDRYNMRRLISMTANIEGEDLGRVASQIARALQKVNDSSWTQHQNEAGKSGWKHDITGEFIEGEAKPQSSRTLNVDVRGQAVPMQEMFGALAGGKIYQGLTLSLGLAVVCIFLLLTAYFQSVRLAIASVAAVPAVIVGVIVALFLTGTTLNFQSFMGAIMAVGVAVANAILLLTFAEKARRGGMASSASAVEGAQGRLRPILMTSCAMIAGMMPLALAIGEGGEQTAALGRAVIGGLVAATFATLIVLPSVFAILQGRAGAATVSLDPDDPESHYFDKRE